MLLLLLLFVVLPMVEFSLLYRLATSDLLGLPGTVALVLFTGALGAWLARQQGLKTLARIQQELSAQRMPGDALFDGALILVAGAVLVTPGVLTDAFGFALLIPPVRSVIKQVLRKHFAAQVHVASPPPGGPTQSAGRSEIIDAQVIETRVR